MTPVSAVNLDVAVRVLCEGLVNSRMERTISGRQLCSWLRGQYLLHGVGQSVPSQHLLILQAARRQ